MLLLVILMQPCPRLVGMERGMRRDTAKERIERKERGKENAKVKESKEKRKGERKAKARATAEKETEAGGMSNVSRGGLNRFVVTVDTLLEVVPQETSIPAMARTTPDRNLVQVASNPSQSVVSDPGSSVSQRVQAVNSSPVPPVCWSTALWMFMRIGLKTGLGTIQRTTRVSGTMMRVPFW